MPGTTSPSPALAGIDAEIRALQDQISILQDMRRQYAGTGGRATAAAAVPKSAVARKAKPRKGGKKKMSPGARAKVGSSVGARWAKARAHGFKSLKELAAWEKAQEGKGAKAKKSAKAGKAAKAKKGGKAPAAHAA
ncbi:MAG TPA: hypothetical protein VFD58_03440 [Blastocatellia bacterium]|nr:hypothetical protein [Blastocatellia bacterium]